MVAECEETEVLYVEHVGKNTGWPTVMKLTQPNSDAPTATHRDMHLGTAPAQNS